MLQRAFKYASEVTLNYTTLYTFKLKFVLFHNEIDTLPSDGQYL